MRSGFITLPFKAESENGLSSVNGIAKVSAAGIVFEFEKKLLGLFGQGIMEMKLPISEILYIRYKRGIFRLGAKIEITPKSLSVISELPRNKGKLILKIARDDMERAQAAVDRITKAAEEREALPPLSPVSSLFNDEGEEEETKLLNEK